MLLQRGDVAPTGSARRRAPPSAEAASCATGCAGKAAPRDGREPVAVAGKGGRDSGGRNLLAAAELPRSTAQAREADCD